MNANVLPVLPQSGRFIAILAAFIVIAATIVWRLYDIQVQRRDDLAALAERRGLRTWEISAPRGTIVDAQGTPMATSVARWALYADPAYMTDKLSATVAISSITEIPRDELRRHFEAPTNGRLISRGLNDSQAEAIREHALAGIHLRREYQREYPLRSIAPHVLGFVLHNGTGGMGIEQRFNAVLAGVPGRERLRVDAYGRPVLLDDGSSQRVDAVPGNHVQLTIIEAIQRKAEEALVAAAEKHKPASACVVVLRPTTGEVVALASWPSYDIQDFQRANPQSFANHALNFVYESGSTMKPLIAGAAVADGLASWDEAIDCEGGIWRFQGRTIHDHSYKHGGHGMLQVADIIAKSDNIGMAKLGLRLGPQRLYEWVRTFGFGQPTGILLPGEEQGIVRPKSLWNKRGSCMSVPMGHELAVTPLQMACAHAAVANGGIWRPPQIVHDVFTLDPETNRRKHLGTDRGSEPRRILSVRDAAQVQDAMRRTMTSGTGKRLQLDGYSSAGKTGTTEKLIDGEYRDDRHIGSFVGWAPASIERPAEFLALAVMDDPQENGYYGSQTGGPVVQEVLQFALEYAGVQPDRGDKP